MNEQDYEQLTLYPAASPASRFPWLESRRDGTMTATFGQKCSELSESLRRVGWSVRTYLESCELPLKTLYRTWSVRVLTSQCLILRLRLSERRTDGSESFLWPTVTAMEANLDNMTSTQQKGEGRHSLNLCKAVKLWPTPAARDYKGSNSINHLTRESDNRNHADQLANAVKLWPTPRCGGSMGSSKAGVKHGDLGAMAALYPTPTVGAGLCGGTGNYQQLKRMEAQGQITEEERRNMSQGNGGQLNPDWVEWMMGLPVGWTSL